MHTLTVVAVVALVAVGAACGAGSGTSTPPASPAQAKSSLFGLGRAGTVLLRMDVETGTTEVVGTTGVAPQSLALAITPDGRSAYTIANAQDPAQAHLGRIDLMTGTESLVGTSRLGQDLYIMGMTLSPDGILYAAGDFTPTSPTFNSLYTVDLKTGVATRVGSFGIGTAKAAFMMALFFSPDRKLYGASQTVLYTIDRQTGAATKVVDLSGASKVMGMAFDKKGRLYACDFVDVPQGSTIYSVDLASGQLKPLFQTGFGLIHNIAFA